MVWTHDQQMENAKKKQVFSTIFFPQIYDFAM